MACRGVDKTNALSAVVPRDVEAALFCQGNKLLTTASSTCNAYRLLKFVLIYKLTSFGCDNLITQQLACLAFHGSWTSVDGRGASRTENGIVQSPEHPS